MQDLQEVTHEVQDWVDQGMCPTILLSYCTTTLLYYCTIPYTMYPSSSGLIQYTWSIHMHITLSNIFPLHLPTMQFLTVLPVQHCTI